MQLEKVKFESQDAGLVPPVIVSPVEDQTRRRIAVIREGGFKIRCGGGDIGRVKSSKDGSGYICWCGKGLHRLHVVPEAGNVDLYVWEVRHATG